MKRDILKPVGGIISTFLWPETYGLLHFYGYCLRFPLASDEFSKGNLLQGERLPFERRKTVSCKLKGHHLKLKPSAMLLRNCFDFLQNSFYGETAWLFVNVPERLSGRF